MYVAISILLCYVNFTIVNFQVDRENPWFGSIPRIVFRDKSTYSQSSTKKYDVVSGYSRNTQTLV